MTTSLAENRIARRSLHTELVDRLRDMIVEGDLAPGDKVPEKDLCLSFGVSRTPMREALKVLATEGMVVLAPNRGAWVSRTTVEELAEVFPVMGALEALSGELACVHISDADVAHIQKLHDTMLEHYKADRLPEYFRANQAIHEAILEAADNETLSAQYRTLASRIRRVRYIANMTPERWARAVDEHEQMIEALKRRDGRSLSKILRKHLENKFETIRAWLERHPE